MLLIFPNGRSLRAQSGSFPERAENAFEVSAVCRAQAGLRKDGATIPVRVSLTPVATAAGQFALAVIRDITALPVLRPRGTTGNVSAVSRAVMHRDSAPGTVLGQHVRMILTGLASVWSGAYARLLVNLRLQ